MTEKFSKGGVGFCLVEMKGGMYNEGTGVKGVDGKEIIVGDVGFRREHYVKTKAKVIQLPIGLSHNPITMHSFGFPPYGACRTIDGDMDDPSPAIYSNNPPMEYKLSSDIRQEVCLHDDIYFKWRVVFSKQNLIAQSADKPPSFIFKVPYDHIYCAVRDGNIIMIGSHVLIDPVWEQWEDILVKTYYQNIKNPDGSLMERPKKEWILKKASPDKKDRQGIIAHIGSPLKGWNTDLKQGDRILYKAKLNNLVTIEGKKYFVLRQDQIVCRCN